MNIRTFKTVTRQKTDKQSRYAQREEWVKGYRCGISINCYILEDSVNGLDSPEKVAEIQEKIKKVNEALSAFDEPSNGPE